MQNVHHIAKMLRPGVLFIYYIEIKRFIVSLTVMEGHGISRRIHDIMAFILLYSFKRCHYWYALATTNHYDHALFFMRTDSPGWSARPS